MFAINGWKRFNLKFLAVAQFRGRRKRGIFVFYVFVKISRLLNHQARCLFDLDLGSRWILNNFFLDFLKGGHLLLTLFGWTVKKLRLNLFNIFPGLDFRRPFWGSSIHISRIISTNPHLVLDVFILVFDWSLEILTKVLSTFTSVPMCLIFNVLSVKAAFSHQYSFASLNLLLSVRILPLSPSERAGFQFKIFVRSDPFWAL